VSPCGSVPDWPDTARCGQSVSPTLSDLPSPCVRFDKKYWATYKVLDILQKVFYRSNPAREAFVEMCESDYVQKMTFDSYLYKTVRWKPAVHDHVERNARRLWHTSSERCHDCFHTE
jgi:hypothetical protein